MQASDDMSQFSFLRRVQRRAKHAWLDSERLLSLGRREFVDQETWSRRKIPARRTWTKLDVGFRVLKIDTSNMKEVYYTPDAVTQEALPGLVDNIRADRSPEDLLFQVLLDWGVDLALPISQQTIAGKTVFFVDGNALAACFETGIDEDFVKQLAAHKPLRVVFRDAGFVSDSVKINVEQVFKLLSPATEIKTL
jgi:adenine-specific DNA-methyltransferase